MSYVLKYLLLHSIIGSRLPSQDSAQRDITVVLKSCDILDAAVRTAVDR